MRKAKYDEKSQRENLNRAANILIFVKCKIKSLVLDSNNEKREELDHSTGKGTLTYIFVIELRK